LHTIFKIYRSYYECFLQLAEKTERVFNASSTLTPDSMMSDESQSRDWQLTEPLAGSASSMTDGLQFATKNTLESDVCHFSTISAEAAESSVHDNLNKCEYSEETESLQLHNCCMLSGIDVSSVNSDSNISVQSADVSADAELNDARLSATDGDSSFGSTLKGSDVDELNSKHCVAKVDKFHPTVSVSIPISTVFEMDTRKDENADVQSTDIKSSSSSGQCSSEPVREAYSPISDAGEETKPVPSTPPVNNRRMMREFSPISPFTPRPSAPNTPLPALPVVPLYWSQDASLSAAAAADWSTSASVAVSDVIVSASAASQANNFSSSYSYQSKLNHGNQVRPTEVNVHVGLCQNVGLEQQHGGAISQHSYQQLENQYPSPVSPHHWYHSQQPYMHYGSIAGGSMSTNSLCSTQSQKQDAAQLFSVEAGKYALSASSVHDSNAESHRFAVSSHRGRSVQEVSGVGHLPPVGSHTHINDYSDFDGLQVRHSAAASNG